MGDYTRQHSFTSGEKPTEAQWNVDINGIITLVNANLDADNVDYSSADGICVKNQDMSVTKDWTFAQKIIHNGGWDNPVLFGTRRFWFDATAVSFRFKDGSDPSSETDSTGELMESG